MPIPGIVRPVIVDLPVSWSVISAKKLQLPAFAVQLENKREQNQKIILHSLHKDKLLISKSKMSMLFIYSGDGQYLSNISIKNNLFDATWTPHGKIVYTRLGSTLKDESLLVVNSETGIILSRNTQVKNAQYLSVSNDGIIYVTENQEGVYQSEDDGIKWEFVFKPSKNKWVHLKTIKITNGFMDEFWSLEMQQTEGYRLSVQSRERLSQGNWTLPTHLMVDKSNLPTVIFDGKKNVLVNRKYQSFITVYSMTNKTKYEIELNTSSSYPLSMAVDNANRRLYVTYDIYKVGTFELIYDSKYA